MLYKRIYKYCLFDCYHGVCSCCVLLSAAVAVCCCRVMLLCAAVVCCCSVTFTSFTLRLIRVAVDDDVAISKYWRSMTSGSDALKLTRGTYMKLVEMVKNKEQVNKQNIDKNQNNKKEGKHALTRLACYYKSRLLLCQHTVRYEVLLLPQRNPRIR